MKAILIQILKFLFQDIILNILYFPIWWYSKGLLLAYSSMINRIKYANNYLALNIWVLNWFKPMFAQTDWQGHAISIVMRTVQIIFRFILLIFWIIIICGLFILWIILPLFIIYNLISNLLWIIN